jgi:glutamine amidotransferase
MTRQIVLIDYGSGNLRSAEKALRRAADTLAGAPEIVVSDRPDCIGAADALVFPGVGAFSACRGALMAHEGLLEAITEAARRRAVPFLGICVGMQLLAQRGLEFGDCPGLGWIAGDVRRLQPASKRFKLPHMGWNDVRFIDSKTPFAGLDGDMYFTHSFALNSGAPDDIAGWSDHGGPFVAAVVRDNLAGVQFHPEKSQGAGLAVLAAFLKWRP